jgi:hypothetical protein
VGEKDPNVRISEGESMFARGVRRKHLSSPFSILSCKARILESFGRSQLSTLKSLMGSHHLF